MTGTDADLLAALRRAGVADVDGSGLARALYSSDASLYRVLPRVVVRPRHVDEIEATLGVCRSLGVPLTARGAGTSIAGNAVGPGVVLDTSRHLHRVLDVDPERAVAVVEPGVVQSSLQAAARPHGLRFGPDPSTHNRCTIGGMIGNNACGSRALAYGRTSDNVTGLDVVTGSGTRLRLGARRGQRARRRRRRSRSRCASSWSPTWRRSAPSSAASPARGPATPWSSCCPSAGSTSPARWSAARARWPSPSAPPSRWCPTRPPGSSSSSATPRWPTRPTPPRGSCRTGPPRARGWTPASCNGCATCRRRWCRTCRAVTAGWSSSSPVTTPPSSAARAVRVVADAGALDSLVVTDPAEAAALWRIREDGAGLAARTSEGRPAHAGWEDAAVPVAQLGPYLRDFEALLAEHRLHGVPVRPLRRRLRPRADRLPVRPGPRRRRRAHGYRAFVEDAARLVAGYGGSHVGRARRRPRPQRAAPADVLRRGDRAVRAGQGPVRPRRPAQPGRPRAPGGAGRRRPGRRGRAAPAGPRPGLPRTTAATSPRRSTAAPASASAAPTCRDRRGDVPVLPGHPRGEGLHPRPGPGAPGDARRRPAPSGTGARPRCTRRSTCACPARAAPATAPPGWTWRRTSPRCCTSRTGAGCVPARTTRSGRLPRWADLAARAPGLVNAADDLAAGRRLARWSAGVDQRRDLPTFAPLTFQQLWARPARAGRGRRRAGRAVGRLVHRPLRAGGRRVAAVRVLEAAGYAGAGRRRRRLLRPDLDHHRAARRRADDPAAHGPDPRPVRRRGRPRRRAGAVLHGRAARRRDRAARRPGRGPGRGRRPTPWPSCSPPLPAGRPRRWTAWRSWPSRTATTTPSWAGPPTRPCCATAGATVTAARRLLRPGRQLRAWSAATTRSPSRCAEQQLLPAVRDARPGRRSCWPTGSPAAPSSTSSPTDAGIHLAELLDRASR